MTLPRQIIPGKTYMLTRRTEKRQFLLRPDDACQDIFTYCYARMCARFNMIFHGTVLMSNHYHPIVTDVEGRLPEAMHWLNTETAKAIKKLRGWKWRVWGSGSYHAKTILDGQAFLKQMGYMAANPVRAGLVDDHQDYKALMLPSEDDAENTITIDRSPFVRKGTNPDQETLKIAPPPFFEGDPNYAKKVRDHVNDACQTALREREDKKCLGWPTVIAQDIESCATSPNKEKPKRNSQFSATCVKVWKAAVEGYYAFVAKYKDIRQQIFEGADKNALEFPYGTWRYRSWAGYKVVNASLRNVGVVMTDAVPGAPPLSHAA